MQWERVIILLNYLNLPAMIESEAPEGFCGGTGIRKASDSRR